MEGFNLVLLFQGALGWFMTGCGNNKDDLTRLEEGEWRMRRRLPQQQRVLRQGRLWPGWFKHETTASPGVTVVKWYLQGNCFLK